MELICCAVIKWGKRRRGRWGLSRVEGVIIIIIIIIKEEEEEEERGETQRGEVFSPLPAA